MLQRLIARFDERRQQRAARRISPEDAAARARRGAAYLDGADPGWAARIRPQALELSDGAQCVLGQLHGEFRSGLMRTRIWDASSSGGLRLFAAASPEDLGFYARAGAGPEAAALDYAYLTRAWRQEIDSRREEKAASPKPSPRASAGGSPPPVEHADFFAASAR